MNVVINGDLWNLQFTSAPDAGAVKLKLDKLTGVTWRVAKTIDAFGHEAWVVVPNNLADDAPLLVWNA